MFSVSPAELLTILLVALLVFGPKKLPEVAKMLGKTIREFRKTVNDAKATIEDEIDKADLDFTEDIKEINKDVKKLAGLEDEQKK